MVQETDFRRDVEKKIGSKKKEPSIAAKAATRDSERPTLSITSFFLFFPFIFISWRLITLQYCSGFCHTLT